MTLFCMKKIFYCFKHRNCTQHLHRSPTPNTYSVELQHKIIICRRRRLLYKRPPFRSVSAHHTNDRRHQRATKTRAYQQTHTKNKIPTTYNRLKAVFRLVCLQVVLSNSILIRRLLCHKSVGYRCKSFSHLLLLAHSLTPSSFAWLVVALVVVVGWLIVVIVVVVWVL